MKQKNNGEAASEWGRLRRTAIEHGTIISARVELAGACNLRCVHCYLGDSLDEPYGPDFSTKRGVRLMDELADEGCLSVIFTGGELGLRPDWADIAWAAKRKRMAVSLLTNATILTDADVAEIGRLGVRLVGVSLYGASAAVHDGVTGVQGSFDLTVEAIRKLRKLGVRCRISTVVMRDQEAEFRGILALADELDCQFMADPTVRPRTSGSDEVVDQLRAPAEQLRCLYGDKAILGGSREGRVITDESDPHRSTLGSCAAGTTYVHVCANGDVMACVGLGEPFGNIVESSLYEVWRSEAAEHIRARLAQPLRGCPECDLLPYCTQRCPTLALVEDGDLSGPCTRACEIAALVRQLRIESKSSCGEGRAI